MNIDMDTSNSDECLATASKIFDYCGADNSGTLRVDVVMDQFAPFAKTYKLEYSYLRSLLDPDDDNPEITVTKLAKTLNTYSESHKAKIDHDESFNLKTGQAPQDSDSGISTDAGYHLLEELQCELREKVHLVQQLRSQLDFTDRQHEEALAAVTAEKEQLKAHLNILREENASLSSARRDCSDATERLSSTEAALRDVTRQLDVATRRARALTQHAAGLEDEKLTLQEQLSKSKDECHKINEMYASRQSSLLEQNDTLKTEHAELTARLQDQEEFLQQMIKEKVLLEMELKDLLNKSNHTALRMDRSIDISYTEDQMLTALDSLNADSRFSQDNRLLDEESFVNALREDQGRSTNMSLFDEIRLSMCNVSRHNFTDENLNFDKSHTDENDNFDKSHMNENDNFDKSHINDNDNFDKSNRSFDTSLTTTATQTDYSDDSIIDKDLVEFGTQTNENSMIDKDFVQFGTQTGDNSIIDKDFVQFGTQTGDNSIIDKDFVQFGTQTDCDVSINFDNDKFKSDAGTQTKDVSKTFKDKYCQCVINNQAISTASQTEIELNCMKCIQYDELKRHTMKVEKEAISYLEAITSLESDLEKCEDNLDLLQKNVNEGDDINEDLKLAIQNLQNKLCVLEETCANQLSKIEKLCPRADSQVAECQTECDIVSTGVQVEIPCVECVKRNTVAPQRSLRRYLWEPLKSLFQIFAVVCFLCAVSVLYGVSRRRQVGCSREPVPWQWLGAQDLMDLLLRIEYVADVPM